MSVFIPKMSETLGMWAAFKKVPLMAKVVLAGT